MSEFLQAAFIGLRSGGAFALLALGLVVVYKGSGVLNFSQGAIGMVGSYVFFACNTQYGLPVGLSIAIGIASGALVGAVSYYLVIRRLQDTNEMVKVIATLGLLITLESAAVLRYGITIQTVQPLFGYRSFQIAGAALPPDTAVVLGCAIVLSVLVYAFFRWTSFGLRATALREDPMAAAALGISPHPVGLVTWTMGGAIGAIGGIMLLSLTGLSPSILTLLIIPALAAGLLVRFEGILLTCAIGLGIGVLEAELQLRANVSASVIPAIPFIIIIGVLLVRGASLPGRGSIDVSRLPAVADGSGRLRGPALLLVAAGIGTMLSSGVLADAIATSAIVAVLALSVVIVTGFAGQLSVAPLALAGIGALVAARCSANLGLPFLVSIFLGAIAATVCGTVIGAPAVRVRGVNLAIATIGLALFVEQSLLVSPSLTNGVIGINVPNATVFGLRVDPFAYPGRYGVVTIVALGGALLAVRNVRRGKSGRRYLSVRANERGAASLGISVPGAKLGAFAVSSLLAGLAGGLMVFQLRVNTFGNFTVLASISLLAFVGISGFGYPSGSLLTGAAATAGLVSYIVQSEFGLASIDNWLALASGVLILDVMTRNPDGVIAENMRRWQWIHKWVGQKRNRNRRKSQILGSDGTNKSRTVLAATTDWAEAKGGATKSDRVVLATRNLSVRYGSVTALEGISLSVKEGQILGIIGANGAGKTTLIDALTGFCSGRVSGTVALQGVEVQTYRPNRRARLGLVRTFQNLELFEDLTVQENLMIATDSWRSQGYITDLVWPGRRGMKPETLALAERLELSEDLGTRVGDLPQGVRRMVAVARAVVKEPKVLCLDEPAAGLSGSERERASIIFESIASRLGIAVVIVEHNVDIVAQVCDEVVALNFGKVIASGTPQLVLSDGVVRTAYLGSALLTEAKGAPVAAEMS